MIARMKYMTVGIHVIGTMLADACDKGAALLLLAFAFASLALAAVPSLSKEPFKYEGATYLAPQLQVELPQLEALTRAVVVEIICGTVSATVKRPRGHVH